MLWLLWEAKLPIALLACYLLILASACQNGTMLGVEDHFALFVTLVLAPSVGIAAAVVGRDTLNSTQLLQTGAALANLSDTIMFIAFIGLALARQNGFFVVGALLVLGVSLATMDGDATSQVTFALVTSGVGIWTIIKESLGALGNE